MGILAPQWQPPVTENTDFKTIEARLRKLNTEAMEISRRGRCGTDTEEYEVRHATLSLLLCQREIILQLNSGLGHIKPL